jgi:hypothetical protein
MLLEFGSLTDIEACPVTFQTASTKEQAVTNSISEVDAKMSTRHIHDEIDIDIHKAGGVSINTKFVVRPAPDKLSDIV